MLISVRDSMYFAVQRVIHIENDKIAVISILIYAILNLVVLSFVLQSFPHCMKHDDMCGDHVR